VILEIRNMTVASKSHKNNAVKNVSLKVRAGEIVCIAGIDGNGQSEFVYGLTGLEPLVSGQIFLNGQEITRDTIRQRSVEGISHIPEDRQKYGWCWTTRWNTTWSSSAISSRSSPAPWASSSAGRSAGTPTS
jgi:simple sugar transport system ATP-binding protein